MTKFGGFRFFHLAHLSVVFTERRSYRKAKEGHGWAVKIKTDCNLG